MEIFDLREAKNTLNNSNFKEGIDYRLMLIRHYGRNISENALET
jgi:hypothetical protein